MIEIIALKLNFLNMEYLSSNIIIWNKKYFIFINMNKSKRRFIGKIVRGLKGAYFYRNKRHVTKKALQSTQKLLNYFLSHIKNNK